MRHPAELNRQAGEELHFHIESYADDLQRQGVQRTEALRRARAELGSIAAGKENCRAALGVRPMDDLWADLRFTCRMLRKSPGFAAIAIGSLALGIGANTVIFTVAQHMPLDQLSVPHPEQLRLLWWTGPSRGVVDAMWGWFDDDQSGNQMSNLFSYPVYRQLRQSNRQMQDLFAFKPLNEQTVSLNGHPEALDVEMVSGNYYAYAARNAIPRMMAKPWMPPAFSAGFDWRIFCFAAAITLLTGVIFGLAPAWESTRVQVGSALKDSGQTTTHRRRGLAGKAIVITQVALSMLLVVCAGLFVRTLIQLEHAKLGFVSDHLLLFTIEPPQAKYPKASNIALYRQLDQRIKAIPDVQSESLIREPLIAHNVSSNTFIPEGTERKKNGENPSTSMNDVGRDFFATYGIPVVSGRGFDTTDTATSREVAVINEALARKYFPHVNPVGRTFERGLHHPEQVEIVGICVDAKYDNLRNDAEPTFYLPYWQEKEGVPQVTFAVKTRMDRRTVVDAVRKTIASVDDNLPLLEVRTQNEQIAASTEQEHIFAGLTAGFGALALVLAAIGIYGILAYSVSRRTNEIGIRMALGANAIDILRMVLREAGWMTAAGVLIGLAGALALGRLVASLLYGLKPWDPLTLTAAAGLLLLVALAASWIPARRAAGVQPMQALRHE